MEWSEDSEHKRSFNKMSMSGLPAIDLNIQDEI